MNLFIIFVGEPDKDKKLVKIVDITGKKGDTYMVECLGNGNISA